MLVQHVVLYKQRLYLKILAIMRVFTLEIFTTHGENKVLNVIILRKMSIVCVNWTLLMQHVKRTTKAMKLNGAKNMSGTEFRS